MLLTLSAKSLLPRFRSPAHAFGLTDLPHFASEELGLRGLSVQTELLAGVEPKLIDRLRDEADKIACPCLLLIEEEPHPLGDSDPAKAEAGIERLSKVLRVAHRLGCSSVAIGIRATRTTHGPEPIVESLKRLVYLAERLELNVLITPQPGQTEAPEQLTALIRRVGGFRIGSFPDFETAAQTGNAVAYLRAIVPYASAITVQTPSTDGRVKNPTFNLNECLDAIRSVGYDATLSLECQGGDPDPIAVVRQAIEDKLAAEQ